MFRTPDNQNERSINAFTPNDSQKTASPRQLSKMNKLSHLINKLDYQKRSKSHAKSVREDSMAIQFKKLELKLPEGNKEKNKHSKNLESEPVKPISEQENKNNSSDDEDIKPLYMKGTISPVVEEETDQNKKDELGQQQNLILPSDKNFDNMVSFMKKLLTSFTKRKSVQEITENLLPKTEKKSIRIKFPGQQSESKIKPKLTAFVENARNSTNISVQRHLNISSEASRPNNLTMVQHPKIYALGEKSNYSIEAGASRKSKKSHHLEKTLNTQNLGLENPQIIKHSFDSEKHAHKNKKTHIDAINNSRKIMPKVSPSIVIQNGVILLPGSGIRINNATTTRPQQKTKLLLNSNRIQLERPKKIMTPNDAAAKRFREGKIPGTVSSRTISRAGYATNMNNYELGSTKKQLFEKNEESPKNKPLETTMQDNKKSCYERLWKIFKVAKDEPINLIPNLKSQGIGAFKFTLDDVKFQVPIISLKYT